jgi:hypothetical protein
VPFVQRAHRRHEAEPARAGARIIAGLPESGGLADSNEAQAGRWSLTLFHVAEAVLFAREDTGTNLVTVAARSCHSLLEELGVSLHELRLQFGCQAE